MGKTAVESTEVKVYNGVYTSLLKAGMGDEKASKYAYFALELYSYIAHDPKVQMAIATYHIGSDGRKAQTAFRLASGARTMGMEAYAAKFAAKGTPDAGGVISAFVEYFAGFAKATGIEINDCAIAVTKVMLDVLTVIAMSETVIGLWAAALQTLTTVDDIHEMVDVCVG